jgi:hypothetical protein
MNICDQCMRGKLSVWKASELNASDEKARG